MRKQIIINNQLISIREEENATFVNVYVEPKRGYGYEKFCTSVDTLKEVYGGKIEGFIKAVLKINGVNKIKRVIID